MLHNYTPFHIKNSKNLQTNINKMCFIMSKLFFGSYVASVAILSYMQIKNPPQVDWCQPSYFLVYKRNLIIK